MGRRALGRGIGGPWVYFQDDKGYLDLASGLDQTGFSTPWIMGMGHQSYTTWTVGITYKRSQLYDSDARDDEIHSALDLQLQSSNNKKASLEMEN